MCRVNGPDVVIVYRIGDDRRPGKCLREAIPCWLVEGAGRRQPVCLSKCGDRLAHIVPRLAVDHAGRQGKAIEHHFGLEHCSAAGPLVGRVGCLVHGRSREGRGVPAQALSCQALSAALQA
jgi:hypothetical protein